MRLQTWIDRLRSETSLEVKGAAELAAATADIRRDTAYVMYADETATTNDQVNDVRQIRNLGISVVLAIQNRRDKRGDAGITEIEVARDQVQTALLGWEPADAFGIVVFRRGRLVEFAKQTLWWQDEWEVPILTTLV